MLVSKTKHGEWFSLMTKHDQGKLHDLRQKEKFYCPECGDQVILKIGTKRITHFAHKQGAACTESYERESEYHLKGKILLYEWLKSMGVSPKLEPYIKVIAQRPDIGFTHDGTKYAIEYQCSVIPEEIFIKRTTNFLKADIIPIWIMAGKNIKRKGNNRATLSGFDYLFLSKITSQQGTISAFCPVTNTLIKMQHIHPVTVKNVLTQFSMTDLKKAQLSDLLYPNNKLTFKLVDWQNEIRKRKNSFALYGTPQNKFLQDLYVHSLIPSLLPPEIGLPVSNALHIETSAIQWQSYLFIDVINKRQSFTMEQVYSSFKRRVHHNDIKIRKLPLDPQGSPLIAVKEYIHLLVKINTLQKVGQSRYSMFDAKIAQNQIQQEKMERDFYRKNGKIINNLNTI